MNECYCTLAGLLVIIIGSLDLGFILGMLVYKYFYNARYGAKK